MSEHACPGTCNGRYREAFKAYDQALAGYDPLDSGQSRPLPPDIRPWPGEPQWCGACKSRVRLRLGQLERLADLLAAKADGYGEAAAEDDTSGRAGSDARRSPSPAADELDELTGMLCDWEDTYRSIKGWDSAPPRGELASVQTEVIAWLRNRLDGILAEPDIAADFGTEILAWHRGMKRRAKAGAEIKPKPLRCPGCHLMTLFWEEGSDRVDCKNPDCARVFSYADYEKEVEHLALALARGETTREEEMA